MPLPTGAICILCWPSHLAGSGSHTNTESRKEGTSVRIPGRIKLRYRLRSPNNRKIARVTRTTSVRVDQAVACPGCGNPMQLSDLWTFKCKCCVQELTADQALSILDMSSV